jgi:hypothetical protein
MNNKIIYRTTNLWNILLFITISLVFFLIQQSAYSSVSILDKSFILENISKYSYIFIFYLIVFFSVYNLQKISKYLFACFFLFQLTLVVFNLFQDFSKLIVLTSGIQIIFAYYFYNFLALELKSAAYNTTVDCKNLFDNNWQGVHVVVDEKQVGYLTNWDESSFNVYYFNGYDLKKTDIITLRFKNKKLDVPVKVGWTNKELSKVGFFVRDSVEKTYHDFDWSDLYGTLLDMGFEIGYIK